MEPRAAQPRARLSVIRALAEAGIPVGVNVAPVVPGLTDHEIPAILKASADAGAGWASWLMLRLPFGVKDLFSAWLERCYPERRDKVLNRIRSLRGGEEELVHKGVEVMSPARIAEWLMSKGA